MNTSSEEFICVTCNDLNTASINYSNVETYTLSEKNCSTSGAIHNVEVKHVSKTLNASEKTKRIQSLNKVFAEWR